MKFAGVKQPDSLLHSIQTIQKIVYVKKERDG